jgi:hypothetical protein
LPKKVAHADLIERLDDASKKVDFVFFLKSSIVTLKPESIVLPEKSARVIFSLPSQTQISL